MLIQKFLDLVVDGSIPKTKTFSASADILLTDMAGRLRHHSHPRDVELAERIYSRILEKHRLKDPQDPNLTIISNCNFGLAKILDRSRQFENAKVYAFRAIDEGYSNYLPALVWLIRSPVVFNSQKIPLAKKVLQLKVEDFSDEYLSDLKMKNKIRNKMRPYNINT